MSVSCSSGGKKTQSETWVGILKINGSDTADACWARAGSNT